jgi:hypothetical protein
MVQKLLTLSYHRRQSFALRSGSSQCLELTNETEREKAVLGLKL